MLLQRVGVPSFFLLCSIPLCKCTTVFDPLIYWWALRLLPALGYWNCAAMNIGVHRFFWIGVLILLHFCETLLVSLCFLNWCILTPWVYGMNFYGRMSVGFSGAVSLISCAHWSWADVYGCNPVLLWSFQHSRFSCLTCGKKRNGGKKKKKRKEGRRE